jgi:hypothetical protein
MSKQRYQKQSSLCALGSEQRKRSGNGAINSVMAISWRRKPSAQCGVEKLSGWL